MKYLTYGGKYLKYNGSFLGQQEGGGSYPTDGLWDRWLFNNSYTSEVLSQTFAGTGGSFVDGPGGYKALHCEPGDYKDYKIIMDATTLKNMFYTTGKSGSVSFWLKGPASANQGIFQMGGHYSDSGGFAMGGYMYYFCHDEVYRNNRNSSWTHFVITWDYVIGGPYYVYKNKVLHFTGTIGSKYYMTGTHSINIHGNGGNQVDVTEHALLYIYNKVLNSSEIEQLYNEGI